MSEQAVGICKAGVGLGELTVFGNRFFEEFDGLAKAFLGTLIQVVAALRIEVVRRKIPGWRPHRSALPAFNNLSFQRLSNGARNLLLHREAIVESAAEGGRPHIATACGVDHICHDAKVVARLADASRDDNSSVEAGRRLIEIPLTVFAGWAVPNRKPYRLQLGDGVDHLLIKSGTEGLLIAKWTEVRERQRQNCIATDQ